MPSGPVFGTGPRRDLRFGSRMGRVPGLTHHPLMIPDHYRTVESAGKKPSRHEKPTVALRTSVRRHRRAQGDRCALRSIRPTHAVAPALDRTTAPRLRRLCMEGLRGWLPPSTFPHQLVCRPRKKRDRGRQPLQSPVRAVEESSVERGRSCESSDGPRIPAMILSLGDAGPTTRRNQEVREVDGTRHWSLDRRKNMNPDFL
jgi:hypothetical protein